MRAIPIGDPDYPSRLLLLPRPPECIWVEGSLEPGTKHVAIVGMREATVDATDFARGLAREVAAAGAVVISGGALGIDKAAHEGALEAGRTWVLAWRRSRKIATTIDHLHLPRRHQSEPTPQLRK